MQELTNRQLKLARIPDPDGDLRKREMFAHTINGYEVAGSFEHCAALYNDKSGTTLTELRCAASARRWPQGSWSKPMPEDHERISMEEQRRLQCEANISRDRATAERLGITLVYEYPFD